MLRGKLHGKSDRPALSAVSFLKAHYMCGIASGVNYNFTEIYGFFMYADQPENIDEICGGKRGTAEFFLCDDEALVRRDGSAELFQNGNAEEINFAEIH